MSEWINIYGNLQKLLILIFKNNLSIIRGEYILLLDHDNVLNPSTLYEVMKTICNEDTEFIYTDEAIINNYNNKITFRKFKLNYVIDTLCSCNYI